MSELADWEHDQQQEEQLLWEARVAIESCIEQGLRHKLVDSFSQYTREKLFDGYILMGHYNTVKQKYDTAKMSGNISHAVIQGAW